MGRSASPDRLVVASLHGAPGRHVKVGTDRAAALEELREFATVDGQVRVDLLSRAAGTHLGAH